MWYKYTLGFIQVKRINQIVKFSGKIYVTRNSEVTQSQKNVICKLLYVDSNFDFLDLSSWLQRPRRGIEYI